MLLAQTPGQPSFSKSIAYGYMIQACSYWHLLPVCVSRHLGPGSTTLDCLQSHHKGMLVESHLLM